MLLVHTHTHTPSRAPLNESQRALPTQRKKKMQETDTHVLSGIQTRDINNQAAAELRLIPHADPNRYLIVYWVLNIGPWQISVIRQHSKPSINLPCLCCVSRCSVWNTCMTASTWSTVVRITGKYFGRLLYFLEVCRITLNNLVFISPFSFNWLQIRILECPFKHTFGNEIRKLKW
jgi:hypothetical protein